MSPDGAGRAPGGWLAVPCFAAAAQSLTFLNRAPLLPLIMADLGVTPAQAGLLSTAMFAAGAAFAVFTGRVIDRFGVKRVMTASLLSLIASSLALGAATAYPAMLAARAAGGFGLTATFIAGGRYVGALAEGPRAFLAQELLGRRHSAGRRPFDPGHADPGARRGVAGRALPLHAPGGRGARHVAGARGRDPARGRPRTRRCRAPRRDGLAAGPGPHAW